MSGKRYAACMSEKVSQPADGLHYVVFDATVGVP